MNSRWSINRTLAWLLVFLSLCAAPALAHLPIPPKKGEIGRKAVQTVVPDFTLVDQNGEPFQFAKTSGKLVLVTFIFTSCPDICSILPSKFEYIQRTLVALNRGDYILTCVTISPLM